MPDAASPAARAGLRAGDVILAVDGMPIHQVPLANLFGLNWIGGRFLGKAGARAVLRVQRGATEQDFEVTLGVRDEVNFVIESVAAPTVLQLAVRQAWLKPVPAK